MASWICTVPHADVLYNITCCVWCSRCNLIISVCKSFARIWDFSFYTQWAEAGFEIIFDTKWAGVGFGALSKHHEQGQDLGHSTHHGQRQDLGHFLHTISRGRIWGTFYTPWAGVGFGAPSTHHEQDLGHFFFIHKMIMNMDRILGHFSTHHEQRQDLGHFFFFYTRWAGAGFGALFYTSWAGARLVALSLHQMSRDWIWGPFFTQDEQGQDLGHFSTHHEQRQDWEHFSTQHKQGQEQGRDFFLFFFSFLWKVIFSRRHKACKVSSHPTRSPLISRCTMTFLCRKARPSKICRVYLRPTVSVSGPYCFSWSSTEPCQMFTKNDHLRWDAAAHTFCCKDETTRQPTL